MRRVAGCAGALAAADFAAASVVSVGVRARVVSMPAACGGRLFSVMSSASSCGVSVSARKNVGGSRGAVAGAYEQGRFSSGCREWGPGVVRVMRELVGLRGSSTLPLCFSSRVHEHVGPSGARSMPFPPFIRMERCINLACHTNHTQVTYAGRCHLRRMRLRRHLRGTSEFAYYYCINASGLQQRYLLLLHYL
jgi:hypothetical protein